MKTVGIYQSHEFGIQKQFLLLHRKRIKDLEKTLQVLDRVVLKIPYKGEPTELFAMQIPSLLNCSLNMLSRGYFNASMVLLRITTESFYRLYYFAEFPEKINDYIKMGNKAFTKKYPWETVFKDLKNGKLFNGLGEMSELKKRIFNFGSGFVHLEYSILDYFTRDIIGKDYIIGPNSHSEAVVKECINGHKLIAILSYLLICMFYKIPPTKHEMRYFDVQMKTNVFFN